MVCCIIPTRRHKADWRHQSLQFERITVALYNLNSSMSTADRPCHSQSNGLNGPAIHNRQRRHGPGEGRVVKEGVYSN